MSETHVDRVGHDGRPGTEELLGRYPTADHPDIGGQERNGSATYVYVTAPHTMAECPFATDSSVEARLQAVVVALDEFDALDARRRRCVSAAELGATIRRALKEEGAVSEPGPG